MKDAPLWSDETLRRHGLEPPTARVAIPDAPQSVAGALDQAVEDCPDAIALVGRSGRMSFREVDSAANAAASFLSAEGLQAGDRIAVSTVNDLDIVIAFLAVQRIGAIWVGVNRALSADEKRYMCEDAGVSVLLGDHDAIAQVRPLRLKSIAIGAQWPEGLTRCAGARRPHARIDPWAPAAIAYTSGTTGRPKGVVHNQHNIMVAATMAERMAGDQRPVVIRGTVSPLTILNIMIGGPIATLARGVRQVCIDRIDSVGIAEWVKREKINTLVLVPAIVHDLLTRPDIQPDDLQSLTWIVVGAAAVPEHLPALYRERFGHAMTIGYGLTEQPTAVSRTHEGTPFVRGAIGRALPHLEVAILDETGREVRRGESGEICVRATQTGEWAHVYTPALGYWRKPDATAELLRGGWMHTGDIGEMDETGELYIRDRRSELINRGGANIYPAEVERVLRLDARVADCAVLGKPEERLGEVVAAFVEPRAGVDRKVLVRELAELCARELARYKVPTVWRIEILPRNAMGKVAKGELRARLKAEAQV